MYSPEIGMCHMCNIIINGLWNKCKIGQFINSTIIHEFVVGFHIEKSGIKFPVGATDTYYGTEKASAFWLLSSCNLSQILPCHKMK